jgi:hypothetical protein
MKHCICGKPGVYRVLDIYGRDTSIVVCDQAAYMYAARRLQRIEEPRKVAVA